jgi:hypothetical protein
MYNLKKISYTNFVIMLTIIFLILRLFLADLIVSLLFTYSLSMRFYLHSIYGKNNKKWIII